MLRWFYNAKSVFLTVSASLLWLYNVSGVYCTWSKFPCFLLVSRVWDISSLLSIGWRIVPILRQRLAEHAGYKRLADTPPVKHCLLPHCVCRRPWAEPPAPLLTRGSPLSSPQTGEGEEKIQVGRSSLLPTGTSIIKKNAFNSISVPAVTCRGFIDVYSQFLITVFQMQFRIFFIFLFRLRRSESYRFQDMNF